MKECIQAKLNLNQDHIVVNDFDVVSGGAWKFSCLAYLGAGGTNSILDSPTFPDSIPIARNV